MILLLNVWYKYTTKLTIQKLDYNVLFGLENELDKMLDKRSSIKLQLMA